MKYVLVLGAGGMGRRHIKALGKINDTRIVCYDTNTKLCQELLDNNLIFAVYTDLNEVPAADIFCAIIATPSNTHLYYCNWCLSLNIPFLVEKPLSNSLDGITELIEEVNKKKLICGVAYPRRSSPGIVALKDLVGKGEIGDLKCIRSTFSQDFRKYRPDYLSTYYAKLSTGGGAIQDAMTHHVNLQCFFAGRIEKVNALFDQLCITGVEGEDCIFANFKFENGVYGDIHCNQFQKPNYDYVELIGTAGNLRYDRLEGILYHAKDDYDETVKHNISGNWDLIIDLQINEFLSAVESGTTARTSLAEGTHNVAVAEAIRVSQKEERVVYINEVYDNILPS